MLILDPYILQQASCRASLLVRGGAFTSDDWEDLRQELVLDCIRRSPKFDPARGDWQGFVRRVVKNQAAVLVTRRHRTARREVLADDLSHDKAQPDEDLIDTLNGARRHEKESTLQMRIDVERVLNGLPSELQKLARLLSDLTVLETCAQMGMTCPRSFYQTKLRNSVQNNTSICPFAAI
jgi:RNA polymerase sigma-70 factor (ECF subfamily)